MAGKMGKVKAFVFGPSATDDDDDFTSDYDTAAEDEVTEVGYASKPRRAQRTQEKPATVTSLDQHRRMIAVQTTPLNEIVHIRPRSFSEAVTIGESFRNNVPVILNMTSTDEAQALKLIDFCSGMAFVTGGTLEKITTRVFLLTPQTVKLTEADKSQLATQQYLHN